MSKARPPDSAPAGPFGVFRRHSLLWLIPERAARRLSWLVVSLLCIVPVVVILAAALSQSTENEGESLAQLLSERLCVPVRLHVTGRGGPGQYSLADVTLETGPTVSAVQLRVREGNYQAPRGEEVPGRLHLEGGTLRMDMLAWTRGPAGAIVGILRNGRANNDLRSVSLSGFTAELLLGESCLTLKRCIGRAEFTDAGDVVGHLAAETTHGRLSLKFTLTDDVHRITITGKHLPWVRALMTPTLGKTLAGLIEAPSGKLTLANELRTGSGIGDNWMLELDSTLDLSRLPKESGLGGMTGKLDVTLRAWGDLGKPAKLTARVRLPEGDSGAVSDSTLRNLRYLLAGSWDKAIEDDKRHTVGALELSFIVTPNYVCLGREKEDPPSGIFAVTGEALLSLPLGRVTAIGEFLDRLDELSRRWKDEHSS